MCHTCNILDRNKQINKTFLFLLTAFHHHPWFFSLLWRWQPSGFRSCEHDLQGALGQMSPGPTACCCSSSSTFSSGARSRVNPLPIQGSPGKCLQTQAAPLTLSATYLPWLWPNSTPFWANLPTYDEMNRNHIPIWAGTKGNTYPLQVN